MMTMMNSNKKKLKEEEVSNWILTSCQPHRVT